MTREVLNERYFLWMHKLITKDNCIGPSFQNLLYHLHYTPFVYIIDMDSNRAADGINLRYRYGYERKIDSRIIASYLDDRPCSVLEMLVALAVRCEESIMDDQDIGNRTGKWFWDMLENLGLGNLHDGNYNKGYVDFVINRFLNREYKRNGEGGLFTIKDCPKDLRTVEIWYQMCWYLAKYFNY